MRLFVGGFLLIANSDRVNPQKVHCKEFLISVTLSFPQICSQSLVLTHVNACHQWPPRCSRLEPKSHCWFSPFLAFRHPLHFQASSLHCCPSPLPHLSPAAHFSYQGSCNRPSAFAFGLLQSILCKSTRAIFAEPVIGVSAPHTPSSSAPVVLVIFPRKCFPIFLHGQLLI